ncbi:SIMPL domain-containing protein [Gordonia sp. DT218]|uniref:SIMPL domain-containing protein n=1 Tax=unclassified Gordonia (in: high G+C Gram-positive bacteria) TaxID=2657482 RepID=UPI003CFBB9F1
MSPLEIVVRGVARREFRAERAILRLAIALEGSSRDGVYREAVGVHGPVVDDLTELATGNAVIDWSSDSVRVFGHRPVHPDGSRQDPVFSTRIEVEARFADFEALSQFIDRWAPTDGVEVGGVRWDVAEENRRRYERDLRKEAVDDAVVKAQAYADAVGRGAVVATQLADPDMLSDPRPSPRLSRRMAVGAPGASDPALALRAEDIAIAVSVDARFVAE